MTGAGSRLFILGVLLLALSAGTLVWSSASDWLHGAASAGAPAGDMLPTTFDRSTRAGQP